jgi:protein gp37
MYRDKDRYNQDPKTVLKSKDNTFRKPLSWKEPAQVFTCSWSDFFIAEADEWRPDAWEIIKNTPHLQYQILTKRPERIAQCLPNDWGDGYPNVWLGVSSENEELTYKRISLLLTIPTKVRFISAEPLLEGVLSVRNNAVIRQLDWVIIGGESGNDFGIHRYRPMELDWAQELVDFCEVSDVACFNKQLGTYQAKKLRLMDKDGGDMREWSHSLQVRQFPAYYYSYNNHIAEVRRLNSPIQLKLL